MNIDPLTATPAPTARRMPPATLAPSILVAVLLIALRAFEGNLTELLTPFLAPLVALPVLLIFAGVTLAAFVDAVGGLWRREFRRVLPLGICVTSLAAAVYVPWTPLMLEIDFRLHRTARETVARRVLNGDLRPSPRFTTGVVRLPAAQRRLSSGGEVGVELNSVLFYTFRGVLDNFSGFVYTPGDFEPGATDFGGDFKEIRRIRKGWFWVSSR